MWIRAAQLYDVNSVIENLARKQGDRFGQSESIALFCCAQHISRDALTTWRRLICLEPDCQRAVERYSLKSGDSGMTFNNVRFYSRQGLPTRCALLYSPQSSECFTLYLGYPTKAGDIHTLVGAIGAQRVQQHACVHVPHS